MALFHYAFPITNIECARAFYIDILGCTEGRSTESWIDFELFENQLSAHLGKVAGLSCQGYVDGHAVPIPHFGCILDLAEFWNFADQLRQKGIKFEMEPEVRFVGQTGEQATMFFLDPDGNALEFKAFTKSHEVFAKQT